MHSCPTEAAIAPRELDVATQPLEKELRVVGRQLAGKLPQVR